MTKVVHCKKAEFDVYIGRPRDSAELHYGNPFSHLTGTKAKVVVASRQEAVKAFEQWLNGTAYNDVEQDRRFWILAHLGELKGKVLGCWCSPAECHGDVLARLADQT